MDNKFIIKGRDNIAKYVGRIGKEIPVLVKEDNLPAWKDGEWRALLQDLQIWSIMQADKHLPRDWGEMRSQYQHLFSPSNKGSG